MAREFAKGFYKSKAWKNTREAYCIKKKWLCEECLAKGIIIPGEIVHHKIELTPENIKDLTIALGHENLKLVCRKCHGKEHSKSENKRYKVDEYGIVEII